MKGDLKELIMIKEAVEFKLRIILGQFNEIYELFSSQRYSNKNLTDIDKNETLILERLANLKNLFYPELMELGSNTSYGVGDKNLPIEVEKLYELYNYYKDLINEINEKQRMVDNI